MLTASTICWSFDGFAFVESNALHQSKSKETNPWCCCASSRLSKANPEQSKHLETARMKIKGVWVDLVNLRTEVYR